MSSVYLFSEGKEGYFMRLHNQVEMMMQDIVTAQGMKALTDEKIIREALEANGITPGRDAELLAEKLRCPHFAILAATEQDAVFLYRSEEPNPVIVAGNDAMMKLAVSAAEATTRKEQAPILCEIRRRLADQGILPRTSLYMPLEMWDIVGTAAILMNFKKQRKRSTAHTEEEKQMMHWLATSDGHQVSITSKKYRDALSTFKNDVAYISEKAAGTVAGQLKEQKDVQPPDVNLLQQVLTAALKHCKVRSGSTFTVSLSAFCREMGIDYYQPKADEAEKKEESKRHSSDFEKRMKALESYVGIINGVDRYAVCTVLAYAPEKDEMQIACPYIVELVKMIQDDKQRIVTKKNGTEYRLPAYSWLLHSDITNERNLRARELVNAILAGVMARGEIADDDLAQRKNKAGAANRAATSKKKTVKYQTSYRALIRRCPDLLKALETQKNAKSKNTVMERAFKQAYALLEEKTDLKEYFLNFKVVGRVPTVSTLDDTLVITHAGRNENYQIHAPFGV